MACNPCRIPSGIFLDRLSVRLVLPHATTSTPADVLCLAVLPHFFFRVLHLPSHRSRLRCGSSGVVAVTNRTLHQNHQMHMRPTVLDDVAWGADRCCICHHAIAKQGCLELQGFWKNWHASYNLWLVRYMYVPLGGSQRRAANAWLVFTFVALWHDLEWRLLGWAWLMSLLFAPELVRDV